MKDKKRGLVHIYTGDGKGKTTAAIGLGVRAVGHGMKVLMLQFLKGMFTGELLALKNFGDNFLVLRHKEFKKFTCDMTEDEINELRCEVRGLFYRAEKEATSGLWDLLILDEIMASVSLGFISLDDILRFIKNKPEQLELVMTGREAPNELVSVSDYVSEMKMVKHPMEAGTYARSGIEF
ncbi:MAG: cob(I)yrinic acid a,c-diamide adenosyltransferase [Clostridiaceae bacterium]|jgi:cob(I)alamin adenosyltransferase|nr:cob(I)yrinic acid a,c-diamide adenosyltransferase [Clostridiaceae bacterium]